MFYLEWLFGHFISWTLVTQNRRITKRDFQSKLLTKHLISPVRSNSILRYYKLSPISTLASYSEAYLFILVFT